MNTKELVLKELEQNKAKYISGASIAVKLNLSRNSIWKAIQSLKFDGHDIISDSSNGYCLKNGSNILSPQSIYKYINNPERFEINVLKSVDSTNNAAKKFAVGGAPEGTIIIAEEQSAGKGRMSRRFFSPKESGIYISAILRPKFSAEMSLYITCAAACAACDAVYDVSGILPEIKWVNDVYIQRKKIAGILTEASFNAENAMLDYAVLGIGINIYTPQNGFPEEIADIVTSIFPDKQNSDMTSKVAAFFINHFFEYYDTLEQKSFINKYIEHSLLKHGDTINVIQNNISAPATVKFIDEECRLHVVMESGEEKVLYSGEVSIKI